MIEKVLCLRFTEWDMVYGLYRLNNISDWCLGRLKFFQSSFWLRYYSERMGNVHFTFFYSFFFLFFFFFRKKKFFSWNWKLKVSFVRLKVGNQGHEENVASYKRRGNVLTMTKFSILDNNRGIVWAYIVLLSYRLKFFFWNSSWLIRHCYVWIIPQYQRF